MSERFDELLSEVVDSASSAARKPGAAAARQRGSRRRTRRRATTSALLSLAVLGVLGGVAASGLHGPAKAPASHATGVASPGPSSSPTAAGPSASASTSPSSVASTTPSAPPSSTISSPAAPTSSSPVTPVTATENWLTAGQIPFADTMHWSAAAPEHCTGQLEPNSYYAGGCVEHAAFSQDPNTATAMDTVVYTATNAPAEAGAWATPLASQAFYTYPSAADALKAFSSNTQDLLSDNNTISGVTYTTVASAQATNALAIDSKMRDSNGAPAQVDGNLGSASDRHYYFAVKGNLLEVLTIWGGPSISDCSNDAAILEMVAGALG